MIVTAFDIVEVRIGRFKVIWTHDGEGRHGVYNPRDFHDLPLLRFKCFVEDMSLTCGWRQLQDASFLTELPTSVAVDKLLMAGRRIVEILNGTWPTNDVPTAMGGSPWRQPLSLMSHVSLDNFGLKPPLVDWPVSVSS